MNTCSECGQTFKSHQGMLSHQRSIHQGIKVGGSPVFAEVAELRAEVVKLQEEQAKAQKEKGDLRELSLSMAKRLSGLEKDASNLAVMQEQPEGKRGSALGLVALLALGYFLTRAGQTPDREAVSEISPFQRLMGRA